MVYYLLSFLTRGVVIWTPSINWFNFKYSTCIHVFAYLSSSLSLYTDVWYLEEMNVELKFVLDEDYPIRPQ